MKNWITLSKSRWSLLGVFFLFIFSSVASAEQVPGELIVKVTSEKSTLVLSKKLKNMGAKLKRKMATSFGNFLVVQSTGRHLSDLANQLKHQRGVLLVQPNFVYRAIGVKVADLPNDPKNNLLWGLRNTGNNEPNSDGELSEKLGVEGADIRAVKAWEITKGSKEVKVAVIDTGIDYRHPDLKDNMWVNEAELNGEEGVDDDENGYVDDVYGYDFANQDGDPRDGHGHGTHCAGTIGAVHDNSEGVAGVMGQVSLVAIKFLGNDGSGTTEGAIEAIDYATKLDVDVMSNSWGGGEFDQLLHDAIVAAKEKGILFVAAAGNDNADNDRREHYPSNYDVENVVAVAAHNAQDILASFSNWGRKSVHVAAPGRNILSTVVDGGYAVYSGTSMATPHVSGALGLLVAHEGRLPVAEARDRLMLSSEPVRAYRRKVQKGGRLDAYNLLVDFHPERIEPNPEAWKSMTLGEIFESNHPYESQEITERTFTVEGAKFIRVVVKKFELEYKWDWLNIMDPESREVLEKITGEGENYVSDWIDGESITVRFKADSIIHEWGFLIDEVQYQ